MVVSESAATAVWPGRDPLGQTWSPGRDRFFVVVGVVGDSGLAARGDRAAGEAYIPVGHDRASRIVVFARTLYDPRALLRDGRRAAALAGVTPTATMMAATLDLEPRSMSNLFAGLGFIALLLAFTGIYTLMGFAVVQRTRELGVRMALGARRADVLLTLLAQYSTPLAVGVVVGLALAVAASQVFRNQLHGLTPLDPLSHAAGLSGVVVVTLLAILLPARRAVRIDPATALRWE
jgi:hypothetical protein